MPILKSCFVNSTQLYFLLTVFIQQYFALRFFRKTQISNKNIQKLTPAISTKQIISSFFYNFLIHLLNSAAFLGQLGHFFPQIFLVYGKKIQELT